jgi:hypothetical protein
MVIFRKKKPELKDFRASHKWENLEPRYFPELEFLNIMHSIEDWKRKRTILKENAEKQGSYSKAYIDQSGKLLRLDWIGVKPGEVYIQYQGNLPISAFEFRTGLNSQGKRVEDDFLQEDWSYKYDKDNRLVELTWHTYPDLEFKYAYHNEQSVFYSYEYDEPGLLRIYQRNEGLSISGKKFSYEKRVIYDRQRSELLAKHTVAKTAWIPITKNRKNALSFKFGGTPPTDTKIPFCQKCGKLLTFICIVGLNKPFKNQSSLPFVPIFYCFDCLESTITTKIQDAIENPLSPIIECDTFSEVQLNLGKSTNLEDEADARIKLGGLPNWIQDEAYPTCKKCGRIMIFVSQINSDENSSGKNQVLMFGDTGRLYTFVCCNIVTSVMQCY